LETFVPEDHIILGNKKDNFGKWEIKDHADLVLKFILIYVPDEERAAVSGRSLVNADHPQVVEIWNNVFMEFNQIWFIRKITFTTCG
jgi:alanyl-tRNA synthetase